MWHCQVPTARKYPLSISSAASIGPAITIDKPVFVLVKSTRSIAFSPQKQSPSRNAASPPYVKYLRETGICTTLPMVKELRIGAISIVNFHNCAESQLAPSSHARTESTVIAPGAIWCPILARPYSGSLARLPLIEACSIRRHSSGALGTDTSSTVAARP